MLATLLSAALQGVEAELVHVEVNSGETGELRLVLVGLPDTAVKESNDRVFSALGNSGFAKPRARTTINLAPGDVRKEGPMYDLPIALGLLAATDQLPQARLKDFLIAGELGLSGATRPVRGALAMARLAKNVGKRGLILPKQSAQEAAWVEGVAVYAVESLDEAYRFLRGDLSLAPVKPDGRLTPLDHAGVQGDFSEIKGQQAVRRAVEVAVAGNHALLMIGPPGSGKSMLAKRIPSIMPEATLEEALEILSIRSAAGHTLSNGTLDTRRPVRSPHHTISDVGLLGGGAIPGPGEISLAHHGVLFLDELPEFRRSTLEVLRQPLEDGSVVISRSAAKVKFPCCFMLVAAMNPCPCGYLGDAKRECRCSPVQIQRYRSKISGPLLDRIDIHVEAPAMRVTELRDPKPGETSASIRSRTIAARTRQLRRYTGTSVSSNARMPHALIRRHCALDSTMGDILQKAMERLSLSARAYDRILKVSRTIADLADSEHLQPAHLLEAIQYRSLDRVSANH